MRNPNDHAFTNRQFELMAHRAAELRSELSPTRGLASVGWGRPNESSRGAAIEILCNKPSNRYNSSPPYNNLRFDFVLGGCVAIDLCHTQICLSPGVRHQGPPAVDYQRTATATA